jgi:hypothetical protein
MPDIFGSSSTDKPPRIKSSSTGLPVAMYGASKEPLNIQGMKGQIALFVLALAVRGFGADMNEANVEIVNIYLRTAGAQQAMLRGIQMDVEIEAKIPRLDKRGRLRAVRRISCTGQSTYEGLDFSGDNTVKVEVINRYLAAESQAGSLEGIAITPSSYRFRLKATLEQGERRIDVFQLTPRKKKVGLFKGELWVDGQTGAPVRLSGQFVKNPSVFIRRVVFVRDYETRDCVSVPTHISSTVDTRLAGRVELDIRFSNFRRRDSGQCTESEP